MGDYVHCRYCGQFYDSDKNGSGACSYHPKRPVVIGDAGRRFDHADLWSFPCCGKTLTADVVEGSDARPEQAPGCQVAAHVPDTGWRVFLSYARRDEANAVVIESELRRRGHRVWRDRSDMVAGVAWADSIDDAIRKADHVVVVLTRRSVRSEPIERSSLPSTRAGQQRPTLPTGAPPHQRTARLGLLRDGPGQRRLPDSGLTGDKEHTAASFERDSEHRLPCAPRHLATYHDSRMAGRSRSSFDTRSRRSNSRARVAEAWLMSPPRPNRRPRYSGRCPRTCVPVMKNSA